MMVVVWVLTGGGCGEAGFCLLLEWRWWYDVVSPVKLGLGQSLEVLCSSEY